jgi:preprotein translocase subunit SecF
MLCADDCDERADFLLVLALLIFGGGAIREMNILLAVGIVTGTYSTIYIASPVAYAWERFRAKQEERRARRQA